MNLITSISKIAGLGFFILLICLPILLLPPIDYPWPENEKLEEFETIQNRFLSNEEVLSYLA